MTSTALSLATSASSIVEATGLAAQFKSIVPSDLFIALGLGFLIGIVIAVVYRKTYRGVLYSPSFTLTLIMLTLITTPVVMCIKNDIALSMGMVGALSIVRFRTAVKDPMDTVFMFWAIAAGITVGANYMLYAIIGTLVIAVVLFLVSLVGNKAGENYLLVVHYDERAGKDISAMVHKVPRSKLKSKTVTRGGVEATYELRLPQQRANLVDALPNIPGVHDATLVAFQNEIA